MVCLDPPKFKANKQKKTTKPPMKSKAEFYCRQGLSVGILCFVAIKAPVNAF